MTSIDINSFMKGYICVYSKIGMVDIPCLYKVASSTSKCKEYILKPIEAGAVLPKCYKFTDFFRGKWKIERLPDGFEC